MNCEMTSELLHGYLDGELDAARAAEFERHLEKCPACVAELETQESLRSSLRRAQLYEKAPQPFRVKVLSELPHPNVVSMPQRRTAFASPQLWTWLAAAVLILAFIAWRNLPGAPSESVLAAQVVDAHLRSLQPGHLADVISTDQHTVKPWFDGKIDFAPPVTDFASDGFPLQGGRLDVVHGRTVAALVYARRKHLISVFIWPSKDPDYAPQSGEMQGFHWVGWRKNGMEFWAASDVSPGDLQALQQLIAR